MWKYLFGFAGPAQCVEIVADRPMKIHFVPRAGGAAKVCFPPHHLAACGCLVPSSVMRGTSESVNVELFSVWSRDTGV